MRRANVYSCAVGAVLLAALACGCLNQSAAVSEQRTPMAVGADAPHPSGELAPSERPKINATTFFAAGQIHEREGNLTAAAEQYFRSIQADEKFVAGYNRLGIVYDKMDQYEKSVAAFRRAIELSPSAAFLHNNLAYAHMHRGDYDKAEPALRESLRLNPGYKRAQVNLGVTLARQGRYEESATAFGQALPAESAQLNVGLLAVADGRYEQARQSFERALQINPASAAAKEQLARLNALTADPTSGPAVKLAAAAERISRTVGPPRRSNSTPSMNGSGESGSVASARPTVLPLARADSRTSDLVPGGMTATAGTIVSTMTPNLAAIGTAAANGDAIGLATAAAGAAFTATPVGMAASGARTALELAVQTPQLTPQSPSPPEVMIETATPPTQEIVATPAPSSVVAAGTPQRVPVAEAQPMLVPTPVAGVVASPGVIVTTESGSATSTAELAEAMPVGMAQPIEAAPPVVSMAAAAPAPATNDVNVLWVTPVDVSPAMRDASATPLTSVPQTAPQPPIRPTPMPVRVRTSGVSPVAAERSNDKVLVLIPQDATGSEEAVASSDVVEEIELD